MIEPTSTPFLSGDTAPEGHAVPEITRDPFPASTKIHVEGSRPDVRVPMREIRVSPTHTHSGLTIENPAVTLYDTSGPYTDPNAQIDLRRGLPPLRRP